MERKIHASITAARLIDAMERENEVLDDPGFCIACGADADGVEPDARDYPCDQCGADAVYGASELVLMMGLGL